MPRLKPTCGGSPRARAAAASGPITLKVSPSSFDSSRPFTTAGSSEGKKAESLLYNTETLQHGTITPWSGGYRAAGACVTKAGPPRRGQVDLVFVPRGKEAPAGPALRFCLKPGFGPTLPVKNPFAAQKIAATYQSCAADVDADLTACIRQATGKDPGPLGGVPGVSPPRSSRGVRKKRTRKPGPVTFRRKDGRVVTFNRK